MTLKYDHWDLHDNNDLDCGPIVCNIIQTDGLKKPAASIFRVENVCTLNMTAKCQQSYTKPQGDNTQQPQSDSKENLLILNTVYNCIFFLCYDWQASFIETFNVCSKWCNFYIGQIGMYTNLYQNTSGIKSVKHTHTHTHTHTYPW